MREHLAEIHGYARQSREDLEAARQHVQTESERVLQQDLALRVARDEHRVAVASFRQQLIEWQGRVGEMKQSLLQGSTQLERRQAEVQEQAQQIATTSARLRNKRNSCKKRSGKSPIAVPRWTDTLTTCESGIVINSVNCPASMRRRASAALAEADAARCQDHGILSLSADAVPGDHKLGDLLRSLELVDADALNALLLEARRQRRSLRQLLLAGNYLTLYQMALIEAGNLDGLVLGRFASSTACKRGRARLFFASSIRAATAKRCCVGWRKRRCTTRFIPTNSVSASPPPRPCVMFTSRRLMRCWNSPADRLCYKNG